MPRSVASKQPQSAKSFSKHDKARADALFLSIGEGAFVTDGQGRISRINHVALELLGFEESELVGQWYPGIIVAEDSAGKVFHNLERPITRVFLTGKSVSARLYYRRKDGTRIPVSLTVSPVILKGKPVGAIEVFRDISHELALEQAKDDFISIASHQLRTPATGVKQYVGMLLEGYVGKLPAEQQLLLTKAYESNERQLKIIDDLLKVARVDAGFISLQTETVDLIQLLQDVIYEQLGKIEKRHQTIKFQHTAKSLKLNIDSALMRMVFENLIDNASKYTPEGKGLRVRIVKTSKSVVISFNDEGVGIAKRDIGQLFQKFARFNDSITHAAEGSGLGLYWAKQIVDLHNGTISVTSRLHKGSTFVIQLPVNRDGLAQSEGTKVLLSEKEG